MLDFGRPDDFEAEAGRLEEGFSAVCDFIIGCGGRKPFTGHGVLFQQGKNDGYLPVGGRYGRFLAGCRQRGPSQHEGQEEKMEFRFHAFLYG